MSDVLATISNNANALSARLLTDAQAISIGIQPAYYNVGSGASARDVELSCHNGGLRLSITKTLGVFTAAMQTGTAMPSIYWPWVICTTGRIANPLGKYYLYYSGDHIYENGWISMAYSDDLLSGWTDYGKVFRNYSNLAAQTTPLETETPSVVWNEENGEFIMYFHSSGSYTGEAQTSWYLTSADGINWSNRTKMLDIDVTRVPGNAHNGYPHPFEYCGTLFAYTLMGGGNGGAALSFSKDGGYHWETVHKLLGRWCLDETTTNSLYAHHGTIVHMQGMDYWIGIMQNFSSGTQPKVARIVAVPMADLTKPCGKPKVLFEPTDATYEGDNLRSFSIYQEGNRLYLFYHSCVGNNNYFNVAVMEATTAAPVASSIQFTVNPANASVTAGSITGTLSALAVSSDGSAVSYQWYSNTSAENTGGTIITGATASSMAIPTTLAAGSHYFYCTATSATALSVASAVATVTVAAAPAAPTISFTTQPANASVTAGSIAGSLSVLATASDASEVSYQWYSNTSAANTGGALISGTTAASMTIPTTLTTGAYYYYCIATSATAGTAASSVATVTVSDTLSTIATYALTGTANSAIVSPIADSSAYSNAPLAVNGITTYDAEGYINLNGVNDNSLSMAGLQLDETAPYEIHMRFISMDGATGVTYGVSHRLFYVAGVDFNMMIAYKGIDGENGIAFKIETTNPDYANTFSSADPYDLSREHISALDINIAVSGDVLNITCAAEKFNSVTQNYVLNGLSVPSFTTALKGGFYIGNRADGTRPVAGRLTEFWVKGTAEDENPVVTTPTITFTTQPTNLSVYAGGVIGLLNAAAVASDASAVTYQWYANATASNTGGTLISGATSGTFVVPASIAATTYYYCMASNATAGSTASNPVTVAVTALTDLARYTLTGTASAAAPATIADDTGNGNTLTVNGIASYDGNGRLTGGATGQSLYLPSLNLSGNTSYTLFMEFFNTSGIDGQHRLFECVTEALGLQISSTGGNGRMRWETSGSAFASPHDSAHASLVASRYAWRQERLLIRVANDILNVSMQVRDSNGVQEIISMSFTATGFTAALASGVYLLNRPDGTRPFTGALTALRVSTEGGAA